MTTDTNMPSTVPLSARDVLHSKPVDLPTALSRRQVLTEHVHPAPGRSTKRERRAPALLAGGYRALAGAVEELLDFDIGSVMRDAWRAHDGLIEAARKSLAEGMPQPIDLSKRSISLEQHPTVDVVLNEVAYGTIEFTVSTTIDSIRVEGLVKDGRLTELREGECTVTVALKVGEEKVASGTTKVHPHVVVDLGNGLQLLYRNE